MRVILISGKAQNGKDTIASIIKDKFLSDGKKVLLTHYADLLKYICSNYFGWDGNKDEQGRRILQHVGTDVVRKKNPDFWVDFIVTILKYFCDEWDYVIIPDCRFPNEITSLIDNGFDVIYLRVVRPNFISPLTEEQQKHPSEVALDDMQPDFYIENVGSLKDLSKTVLTWIKENMYEN